MADLLVTKADDARSISVDLGDQIILQLAENPTTGYRWELDGPVDPTLSTLSSEFNPDPGGGVGSGGTHVFTFRADQPGATAIRLKLKRPWEQDDAAIERFHIDLQVNS
jgi:inhibitor of cysteine peptidase